MKANTLGCFFILIHSVSGVGEIEYSSEHQFVYSKQNEWEGDCQTGTSQSPLDLSMAIASYEKVERLYFLKYEDKNPFSIQNNGHTFKINFESPCEYSIVGGGLPDVYLLDHIHFHWKSEHLIAGNRLAAEAHFVHYMRYYQGVGEASLHPDGLAVLAVLFQEGIHENSVLKDLLPYFSNSSDKQVGKQHFSPFLLLPSNPVNFYRYAGSLTTPPCSETVVWTVFKSFAKISRAQIEKLQSLSLNGEFQNYRKEQKLNGRPIYVMEYNEKGRMYTNCAKPSQVEKAFYFLLTLAGFYPTLRIYVTCTL